MFSMADVAQFESIYGVDIAMDSASYRIVIKGSADLLKSFAIPDLMDMTAMKGFIGDNPLGLPYSPDKKDGE